MARERTPIPVSENAVFIDVGKASRIIIQPNEYRGTRQIQVATQSARYGRRPEFEDVPEDELTAAMCNIKHGVNLDDKMYEALVKMGPPSQIAVAAPTTATRRGRGVRS